MEDNKFYNYSNELLTVSEDNLNYLAQSPLAYIIWNPKFQISKWSNKATQLFGWSEDEVSGKNPSSFPLFHNFENSRARDFIEQLQNNTFNNDSLVLRCNSKSGNLLYCEWFPSVITSQQGDIHSILTQIHNVTEQQKELNSVRDSLKQKETLLSEIHHRVKNNLAVVSGLLELQGYASENEEIMDILRNSQSRIHSMAMVHEKMYQSNTLANVRLDEYIRDLAQHIFDTFANRQTKLDLEFDTEKINLNIHQAIPLGLLLNELIVNCVKHAFKDQDTGLISIYLKKRDKNIVLKLTDNGVGLPEDFSFKKSKSLGMTLVNTLSKQLEAELQFDSKKDQGTTYRLSFKIK